MAVAQAAVKATKYASRHVRGANRLRRVQKRRPELVERVLAPRYYRKFKDNPYADTIPEEWLYSYLQNLDEADRQNPSVIEKAWGAFRRYRAIRVSLFLAGLYGPIQGLMVLLWVWSFMSLGVGFFVTWIVSGIICGLFMLFALSVYHLRLVDCWSGWKELTFCVCFVLCWSPLFIIPWPVLWFASVAWMQNGNTQAA